jgi:Tol biopolymer transport system component
MRFKTSKLTSSLSRFRPTLEALEVRSLLSTGQIAFVSARDGNDEIYVMEADGSNPTNLTNNAAPDQAPAWSPDGSKIAFESDRHDPFAISIYVMLANGTNQVRFCSFADASASRRCQARVSPSRPGAGVTVTA